MSNSPNIIAAIRRTASQKGRRLSGLYSIEGIRLHERAVRAGCVPVGTVVSARLAEDPDSRIKRLLGELEAAGGEVHVVSDQILEELTEGRGFGEMAGLVALPTNVVLLPEHHTVLVGSDISDPGNCGALVRTGLAGGADLFLAAGKTDPFHPKSLRTSMGSLFKMPVRVEDQVEEAVATLKQAGYQLIGLSCDAVTDLPRAEIRRDRVAVIMGSESFGLPDSIRNQLDIEARIPMPEGVDSFSVNAAAAIVLYEINRDKTTR
jgi:TrmH family RNA methyltransferase